jgi:N-methylhydantoinase A/acetophenone carboxylase
LIEVALYSLDIDIGGTFTDGFFTNGEEVKTAKVLTTPHDVTEGFLDCIRFGSRLFDVPLDEFLRRTAVARLSTTIGTNLLVQQKGARIGLIVTAGAEISLYSADGAKALGKLVKAEMVSGIAEEVDDTGEVRRPIDSEDVLARVRDLIQLGAQLIVVSLRNAWRNPANEKAVRRIVRERYPIHYLRSVPVQLAVEVVHDRDDHARTNSALLNAYIHAEMARVLFRAEDRLRDCGYDRPLLIVHANGGNARVAKTIALNTLHSGPAVAVRGAAVMARRLALDHVVSTDMGGTSFDVGFVANGSAKIERSPTIEEVPIASPAIQVNSVGLGGGSIAAVDAGTLTVGPESAGSAPGPVCYGKGGSSPTVTDANVVLGFIDPDFFLGGRMKLDVVAARRAIERRLARQLGSSIEQVAYDIRALANRHMADEITRSLAQAGVSAGETSLFSVGGAGPLHACDIAELAGLQQAVAFPFGSVFSAFGGSTTDVQHVYRRAFSHPPESADALVPVLRELVRQAERDMHGEGFSPEAVKMAVDAEFGDEVVAIADGASEAALADAVWRAAAGQSLEAIRVVATSPIPHWDPPRGAMQSQKGLPRSERPVWWERTGAVATPVFDRDGLARGDVVNGPAIVEGPDTVYAVRPGWHLTVEAHGFFIMARG